MVTPMISGLTEQVAHFAAADFTTARKATNAKFERMGAAVSEVRERLFAAAGRVREREREMS